MFLFISSAEILRSNLKDKVRSKFLQSLLHLVAELSSAYRSFFSYQPFLLIFPVVNSFCVVFYSYSQDDFDQHRTLNELMK